MGVGRITQRSRGVDCTHFRRVCGVVILPIKASSYSDRDRHCKEVQIERSQASMVSA